MIFLDKDLPQKSQKWLDFRKDKIGTSEISILKGKFPTIWCDPYELFLIKMGKPNNLDNTYVQIGNENESKARKLIESYYNKYKNNKDYIFSRNVYDRIGELDILNVNFEQYTVQHKKYPKIFSSFDGIDIENKLVVEIKCPSQQTFTKLLKNRKPTIPKMYYDQIQGQLWIANSHWGITQGIFAVYFQDGVYFEDKITKKTNLIRLILIKTELDLEYCKELEKICSKFLEMIENRKWRANWNKYE